LNYIGEGFAKIRCSVRALHSVSTDLMMINCHSILIDPQIPF
jgi:hypothetical protein